MDLDELRGVRRTERQKDSLQHLRDSFYGDVADYVADRKAARSRAADRADDPFSDPEVSRLTDEIEAAEEVVESIYERRVGKVVKLASFAAADMSADTNGLTTEERDLFEDLVTRIKQNRTTVLDVLGRERSGADASTAAADASAPETAAEADVAADATEARARDDLAAGDDDAPPTPPDVDPESTPGDVLADAMGETDDSSADAAPDAPDAPDPPEGAEDASATTDRQRTDQTAQANAAADEADASGAVANEAERVTLRITSDVGQILGVDDREYDLATEDVVTLPTTNADPLVERGAAERLD